MNVAQGTSSQFQEQSWMQNWQMPALVGGIVMFALGLWLSMPKPKVNDYVGALKNVEQYLENQNIKKAENKIAEIKTFIKEAPKVYQASFFALRGDKLYVQQRLNGWDSAAANLQLIEYYQKSREMGHPFDTKHIKRWAQTLVSLDRDKQALDILADLPDQEAEPRYTIVREIITKRLEKVGTKPADVLLLLDRFLDELKREADPKKRRTQQMWGATQQASLLLDVGDFTRTIDYLNLKLIRFRDSGSDQDLGPLMILLAKAYQQLGKLTDASRWYRTAKLLLSKQDSRNAEILVGQAQITLAQTGNLQEALEGFSSVEQLYPSTTAYMDALMGRANCEARLGHYGQATDYFSRSVEEILNSPRQLERKVIKLIGLVRANYAMLFGEKRYVLALNYLSTLTPLYGDQMPNKLLADFAITYEKIADTRRDEGQKLALAEKFENKSQTKRTAARRLAFQDAALNYAKAADYYYKHADAVIGLDTEMHANSLWNAAQNYDNAQLWAKAIGAYGDFVRNLPSDSRYLQAVNRLGLAFMADKQYKAAMEQFKMLVELHPKSIAAQESLVPMGRTHIALGQYDLAQRVLEAVIGSHPAITPEAAPYHDALIELGKLYYQRENYEKAIAILEEVVTRYGEDADGPSSRYRLADTYRQSVEVLDVAMKDPMAQAKLQALVQERAFRLKRSQVLYTETISGFEAREYDSLSKLEKIFYRNAYFYRADAAYDLKDFENAIMLYDLAAKRWESTPASLVALIQIVNAYCERNMVQEARVANDRARWQLKRIPDKAFEDPTLPMDRKHWESWLRWTTELNLFASAVK